MLQNFAWLRFPLFKIRWFEKTKVHLKGFPWLDNAVFDGERMLSMNVICDHHHCKQFCIFPIYHFLIYRLRLVYLSGFYSTLYLLCLFPNVQNKWFGLRIKHVILFPKSLCVYGLNKALMASNFALVFAIPRWEDIKLSSL